MTGIFYRAPMLSKQRARLRSLRRLVADPGVPQVLGFQRARHTADYRRAFEIEAPLVSVCIATFNRGKLVTERAVASILAQTYVNLEVIVVGDACTDDTAERMAAITDPRLTFVNLDQRGVYPEERHLRWMVAGTKPINHALGLARADWITHLDDDDFHPPERLEKLLAFARQEQADFVWHPFRYETDAGWQTNEAPEFAFRQVTTSSVFYHAWFKRVRWDIQAWRHDLPGDWHRFQRIKFHLPRYRRFPEPLLDHFREQNQAPAR